MTNSEARKRAQERAMKPSFAKKPEGTATVALDDLVGCATPDCPGDVRYAAPGRGHVAGCIWPRNIGAQAAASQVQGAAEVGADHESLLANRILGCWVSLSAATVEQTPIDHCRAIARNVIGAGWVPAERVAEARAEGADLAHDAFCPQGRYCSMHGRPGDRAMVAGLKLGLDGDQGGGLLDEDGGA